jgi:prepilin-type N-terminal cleavage/methylation domain-containing protein
MKQAEPPFPPLSKDERGLTLIELLTGLLLFGMVIAILYSFLFMGISMYKRISVDTQLRNQADSLYSRIMTELSDAVYVKQQRKVVGGIAEPDYTDIVYVKMNRDNPEEYVDTFHMKIDEDGRGIIITDSANEELERFPLTDRFAIDLTKSKLAAEKQDLVQVQLYFNRSDNSEIAKADRSNISIESKIPLFREE